MTQATEKFSTTYYETHGIPTAPNGDKLRSDDEGLFFWIEGERVPYPIPADYVPSSQRVTVPSAPAPASAPAPTPTESKTKAKKSAPATDQTDGSSSTTGQAEG